MPPDLDYRDIGFGLFTRLLYPADDLGRHIRNHLHVAALVLQIALAPDDLLVDTAGRHVVGAGQREVQKALVIAHVLVALVARRSERTPRRARSDSSSPRQR